MDAPNIGKYSARVLATYIIRHCGYEIIQNKIDKELAEIDLDLQIKDALEEMNDAGNDMDKWSTPDDVSAEIYFSRHKKWLEAAERFEKANNKCRDLQEKRYPSNKEVT